MAPGSSVMVPVPKHGLRVLSLDGGGVRGLSTLLILRHVMKRISPQNTPKPCEYFDLIAGTSTGGLIAIMLGRLQMSIQDCIMAYQSMSERVFSPKRTRLNVVAKGKDLLTLSGAFDEEELERVVREIVVKAGEPADAKLYERDPACKIFVCATRAEVNKAVRLRSYETLLSVQEVDCTIVEAARATSAASSFFKPVIIQGQSFVDGATAYNNPVEEVLEEAEQIWDARDLQFDKFLSIGTGRPSLKPFGKNLAEVAKTLVRISTDTEKAAERFEKVALRYKGLTGLYFRFNSHGLEGVGLEDKESFGSITAATNDYLNEHDTLIKLNILSAQNISLNLNLAEKQAYLQSLPTYDVAVELDQIPFPVGNTFEWVFDCQQFKDWSCRDYPILQVRGKPGSGKSVLMASLKRKMSDGPSTLAFFACKQTEKDRRTPEMILSSLLGQILEDQPNLFRYVAPQKQGSQSWSYQQLLQSFRAVLTAPDNKGIICFIDALDEAHEVSRRNLARDLSEIFEVVRRRASAGFSRILISSRHFVDTNLPSAINIDLDSAAEMVKDLRRFADMKIEELVIKRPLYAALSEQIHQVFEDRADGMYRLVELVVEDLENMTVSSTVAIQRMLHSLPHDISDIYDMLWARIRHSSLHRATLILTWILFSFVPVRHDTLAGAIAVFSGPNGSTLQDVRQNIPVDVVGDIQRLFGPLIRVTKSWIQPSHPSVRDHFLQRNSLLGNRDNKASDRGDPEIERRLNSEAHTFMALTCLKYLNWEAEEQQNQDESSGPALGAFHDYASTHFASHVSRATRESEELDAEILSFFEKKTPYPAKLLQQPLPHEYILGTDTFIPAVDDVLSFAAYYGRPAIVQKFRLSEITNGHLVCSNCSCPGWRIRAIYLSMVGLSEDCLLESILLLDSLWLAPSESVDFISLAIAEFQTEYGDELMAKFDACDCSGFEDRPTSLSQQVYQQIVGAIHHIRVTSQCVERSEENANHLQQAILKVFRTLLNTNFGQRHTFAAFMDQDWTYNLALIVSFYMKETYGTACVNLLSRSAETLIEAVQSNRLQAVRILLSEGIDVGSVRHGASNASVLHLAAGTGNYVMVQAILALHQLDINVTDDFERTPLHYACSKHAGCNNTGILGTRPASISRSKIVKMLLQLQADKKARDQFGNTPFQTLSRVFVPEWDDVPKSSSLNWRETDLNDTLPQLLSDVEDVIHWDRYGATPLHNASYFWPLSSIRILVSFLATYHISGNLNLVDSLGHTPLHYAAIRGFDSPEKIIDALCEAGIDPRVRQLYGETALAIAKTYGREAAAKALLELELKFDAEAARNSVGPLRQRSDPWRSASEEPDIVERLELIQRRHRGMLMPGAVGLTSTDLIVSRPKQPIMIVLTETANGSPKSKSPSVSLAAPRKFSMLDAFGPHTMDYPSMVLRNQIDGGRRILRLKRPELPLHNMSIPRDMLHLLSLRIYHLGVDPFGKLTEAALTRPITTDRLTTLIAREARTDVSGEESLIRASYYRPVKSSETPSRHTDVDAWELESLDDIDNGSDRLVLSDDVIWDYGYETTIDAEQGRLRVSPGLLMVLCIAVVVDVGWFIWIHMMIRACDERVERYNSWAHLC